MLTFEQWREAAEYTMSIGNHPAIQDEALRFTIGYVYPGGFFIEFRPEFISTDKPMWSFEIMDGNHYESARFYHELEKPLYDIAVEFYLAENED